MTRPHDPEPVRLPDTDAYGAQLRRQLAEAREQLAEARIWARHGYEIGQRHCGWTDHGVAPEWLTEGWPAHVPGCESQAELTTLHEGEEPYEDERLVPTPGQWIWLWNRATPEQRLAKAQQVLGLPDIVDRYRAEAIQAAERGDHQLPVRLAAVRAAVHIADDEDVTDWQRGYRACANRVLAALDGRAAVVEPEQLASEEACDHPITEVVANLPRLDLICRACGTILAEHTGDDHLPDFSWLFACPVPFCQARHLAPCVRKNGTRASISHGERWDRYHQALKDALRATAGEPS
jgi:hypothetical protein